MTLQSLQPSAILLANTSDPASQFAAGILFEFGWGVAKDERRAKQLYEQVAALIPAARYRLAFLATDSAAGMTQLRAAAEAEYAPALFDLWGFDGETDRTLLERAAALDYPPALAELGHLFLEGSGAPADRKRGQELLRRAFERGDVEAGASLAIDELDACQPHDTVSALGLLRKSAAQGSARAHSLLSSLYSRGEYGLPKDQKLATFHSDQADRLTELLKNQVQDG